MARQVAHEIKNPLTPIRLGIQHLLRTRHAARGAKDFDLTLEETAERILAEIDRLDAIARAFARFASPVAPEEAAPLEPVDLHAATREVVQLYALGGKEAGARVEMVGDAGPPVLARKDEVKEVFVNLLENARHAGARRIVVRVTDGGRRVAPRGGGGLVQSRPPHRDGWGFGGALGERESLQRRLPRRPRALGAGGPAQSDDPHSARLDPVLPRSSHFPPR